MATEVQSTKGKGMMIVGVLIIIAGFLNITNGDVEDSFNIIIFGIVIYVIGKIRRWYYKV